MTYTHKDSNAAYFHQRAEVELKRANEARCPQAARAHYLLAGHYLNRAFSDPSYAKVSRDRRDNPVRVLALESEAVAADSLAKAQALAYEADRLRNGAARNVRAVVQVPFFRN